MSRAPLDLSYMHEMARGAATPPTTFCRTAAARDLTARLRCLKALIDAERTARTAAPSGPMH